MPSPSSTLTVLRSDLARAYEEFDLAMDRQGFIGTKVAKPLMVGTPSGQFAKVALEAMLRNSDGSRAPRAGYERSDYMFGSSTYETAEYGHEATMDDSEMKAFRHMFDGEFIATSRAIDAVARKLERQVASAIFNPTTFAEQLTTPTHEWDDAENATPIQDVEQATQAIWAATGQWPNALILNRKTFRNLRNSIQIVERINADGAGESSVARRVTANQLAEVFDLDHILIAGSAQNTSDEGQDASISPIWSDEYAMVARIATTDDPAEPCLSRLFVWSEESGDEADYFVAVETYREEARRGSVFRARANWQVQVIHPELGHLIDNLVTTEE